MDSGSETSSWFSDLYDQFCACISEPDDSITQEPIEFLRGQFRTTCEDFKQLCSELVEEALPIFRLNFEEEEQDPISTDQEENTDLVSDEGSNIGNYSSEGKGKDEEDKNFDGLTVDEIESKLSATGRSLESDSSEKTEVISEVCAENKENILLDDEVVSSASDEDVSDLLENSKTEEAESKADYDTELEASVPQNLDESLIIVDADELHSYSDTQEALLYYQKTKKVLLKRKSAKNPLSETEVIDDEEWERFKEDVGDSDWEIV